MKIYGKAREKVIRDLRNEASKRRTERRCCWVCWKHEKITEVHHVISVEETADLILSEGYKNYPILTVWLCPNHHAYWHLLERASADEIPELFRELGADIDDFIALKKKRAELLEKYAKENNRVE